MNYLRGLRKNDPARRLFLAVPESAYYSFFLKADVAEAVKDFNLNLLVYNDISQTVVEWVLP
ncbi:hypothetical protein FAES_2173 [Fibrella aestuarina BUZ 2]|uniref:Uncharacterized protein n=2 Tax=Fibrella TaxID=861914 RepID=I0K7S9_9BACT|nr:hypothetical protein FAES_2173 [Fibrella aestuarina BUZ 2]